MNSTTRYLSEIFFGGRVARGVIYYLIAIFQNDIQQNWYKQYQYTAVGVPVYFALLLYKCTYVLQSLPSEVHITCTAVVPAPVIHSPIKLFAFRENKKIDSKLLLRWISNFS